MFMTPAGNPPGVSSIISAYSSVISLWVLDERTSAIIDSLLETNTAIQGGHGASTKI